MHSNQNSNQKTLCKCPLCNQIVEYQHILEEHEDFWIYKGLYNKFPTTVEEFNKRFGTLGLIIKE